MIPRIFGRAALLLSLVVVFPATRIKADEKPPLRVVVAGLVHGHAGDFFSHALKRSDVSIVAVAEPDRKLFDQYAAEFHLDAALYHADLDEALRATHPQAVLAYTSTYGHRKVVETAAHYSVPVMMEKPLATTYEDAQAIARVARDAKIQVLVNYFTNWEPSNHAAYEVLHSGAIGDLRKVVVHAGHQGPKEIGVGPEFLGWLTDPKLNGGGALFDFGCYGADITTWLMDGQRPLTVTAVTLQIKPDVYPKVDDDATIILTYPHAQAILQGSWNWPYGRSDIEVYGRTGSVFTVNNKEISVREPKQRQAVVRPAPPIPAPYDDELTYLRAVLLDGAKPNAPSSLETNLIVVEILDAARRSASSGQTITLPH